MPPFELLLDKAVKSLKSAASTLQAIQAHAQRGDIENAYQAAFTFAAQAEKLTLIARELPARTGRPTARQEMNRAILDSFPIYIGFTQRGWFYVRIPSLLPKKSKGSADYITAPLYAAMGRYWQGRQPVRYDDCVLIYRHVYDRQRPERSYRDHDNFETNRVTDIISMYVMTDDSPSHCRHYYCSAPGDGNCTEVFVVPDVDFTAWLAMEKSLGDL